MESGSRRGKGTGQQGQLRHTGLYDLVPWEFAALVANNLSYCTHTARPSMRSLVSPA